MAELGASGSFCPAHVTLPVKAYFFSLSDDNAPSPYLVRFCQLKHEFIRHVLCFIQNYKILSIIETCHNSKH